EIAAVGSLAHPIVVHRDRQTARDRVGIRCEGFVHVQTIIEPTRFAFQEQSELACELVALLNGEPVEDGCINGQEVERATTGHARDRVPIVQAYTSSEA